MENSNEEVLSLPSTSDVQDTGASMLFGPFGIICLFGTPLVTYLFYQVLNQQHRIGFIGPFGHYLEHEFSYLDMIFWIPVWIISTLWTLIQALGSCLVLAKNKILEFLYYVIEKVMRLPSVFSSPTEASSLENTLVLLGDIQEKVTSLPSGSSTTDEMSVFLDVLKEKVKSASSTDDEASTSQKISLFLDDLQEKVMSLPSASKIR